MLRNVFSQEGTGQRMRPRAYAPKDDTRTQEPTCLRRTYAPRDVCTRGRGGGLGRTYAPKFDHLRPLLRQYFDVFVPTRPYQHAGVPTHLTSMRLYLDKSVPQRSCNLPIQLYLEASVCTDVSDASGYTLRCLYQYVGTSMRRDAKASVPRRISACALFIGPLAMPQLPVRATGTNASCRALPCWPPKLPHQRPCPTL